MVCCTNNESANSCRLECLLVRPIGEVLDHSSCCLAHECISMVTIQLTAHSAQSPLNVANFTGAWPPGVEGASLPPILDILLDGWWGQNKLSKFPQ